MLGAMAAPKDGKVTIKVVLKPFVKDRLTAFEISHTMGCSKRFWRRKGHFAHPGLRASSARSSLELFGGASMTAWSDWSLSRESINTR